MKVVFILVSIFYLAACNKEITQSHRQCTETKQCTLIGTGSCCGRDTAIHVDFANDFKKAPKEICKRSMVRCHDVKAECVKGMCVVSRVGSSELK